MARPDAASVVNVEAVPESSMRTVDAAIIGTGQAAPSLAVALAGRGESVALFEGGVVGGSCVNVGCTPTKALRASARVAHVARHAAAFGINAGPVTVDFAAVIARTAGVVGASRASLQGWIEGTEGVTLVREYAVLDGRVGDCFVVRAGIESFLARRVFLNTGTRPFVPPIPGIGEVPFLTNETVPKMRELPRHLVIVGGSYIGLELGQLFRRLGSEVTIIETGKSIASREDPDIVSCLTTMLRDEGVAILERRDVRGVQLTEASSGRSGVRVDLNDRVRSEEKTIVGSHLLIATGRVPNTDRLGLASVGVTVDSHGFIPTNGRLESSVAGIWAMGDINKRGAFTHTSYQDHEIVLANLTGGSRSADSRVPTYAMYTDPPLGRVGLSETEARALIPKGRRFLIGSREMTRVARALEEGETTGVMKIIVDAETRRVVGATLLGLRADEVVQVISTLMTSGASCDVLTQALPIHPTVAEYLPSIVGALQPMV